jgi:hypothetical protein
MALKVSRSSQEKSLHDQAVADVAKARLPYPDKDNPHLKTYLNEPKQTMSVNIGNNKQIYPDIVVVDTQKNVAAILGEVESESTVTSEEAKQWKEYSDATKAFYLYVPKGTEATAKKLISDNSITVAGIRTWKYNSNDIEITNV